MKKILIVLASVLVIGCSKEETPQPILSSAAIQQTAPPLQNQQLIEDFEGEWNCYNWVVNQINGTTAQRQIIFTGQDSNYVGLTMNEFTTSGIMYNMFTEGHTILDSNYFNNTINVIPVNFKGVLTTDSTLMVYEYNGMDTIQVKEFKR